MLAVPLLPATFIGYYGLCIYDEEAFGHVILSVVYLLSGLYKILRRRVDHWTLVSTLQVDSYKALQVLGRSGDRLATSELM